ncbi:MAG TPA: ABC transporter ATP-binding protein, partial [Gallionellaceae bacterium]
NDLDIETLELLEELLANYDGTLFLVSHDRAFLDNVVTQVIAFEGNGKLMEYVGGYEDWVRVQKFQQGQASGSAAPAKVSAKPAAPAKPAPKAGAKLSFKEARELESIPGKIEELEREQVEVGSILAAGKIYRDDPKQAQQLQARANAIEEELLALMERWETLEGKG